MGRESFVGRIGFSGLALNRFKGLSPSDVALVYLHAVLSAEIMVWLRTIASHFFTFDSERFYFSFPFIRL